MDNRTAADFIIQLEDVVRDCEGPVAKAFDIRVVWYRNNGFMYSCDGMELTREQAVSKLDFWVRRRNEFDQASQLTAKM